MKLSNLKTGDILKYIYTKSTLPPPIFFVLSDTILMTHNENNELLYLEITIQDVLNNKYELEKATIERVEKENLPLDKQPSDWFDRCLKGTIRGNGSDLSKRLKDIVDDYINKQAEIDEVMTMYENRQESG
jgi:hypothetical protein